MAYTQGRSALMRGATRPGPGIMHRSVIVSADTKDMLKPGIVRVDSPEFEAWIRAQTTVSGDLNLTVQIDNTVVNSIEVPDCDPGPFLTFGKTKLGNRSSEATFYRHGQVAEIFRNMKEVSVEINSTNGKIYWYGVLDDVGLYRAEQDCVKGYVIRPGTIVNSGKRRNIAGIGKKQYDITNKCKEWCINNRQEALARRPDLINAAFMNAGMTRSDIANEKNRITGGVSGVSSPDGPEDTIDVS